MVKRKFFCLGVFLFVAVLGWSLLSFAQPLKVSEQPSIIYDKPKAPVSKEAIETMKKDPYFVDLTAYKAVREDNLNVCNAVESPQDCGDCAKRLLMARYMGERKCESLKNRDLKEVCQAFKARDCDILRGWQSDMCEAFLKDDAELMYKAIASSGYRAAMSPMDEPNQQDAYEITACFMGYRGSGRGMCERAAKNLDIPERFLCEIIFSQDKVDNILDNYAKDMMIFTGAALKDRKTCEEIKNKDLRDACLKGEEVLQKYP